MVKLLKHFQDNLQPKKGVTIEFVVDLFLKVFEHFGNFIFAVLNKTTGGTWKIKALISQKPP